MSLDQILMIPGYSADGGGGGADFNLSASNLTAGTPVLGTPALTLNTYDAYLPTVSSSPYMGYSLRLLDAGYVGDAIQVRRSSDNATQDIGFSSGLLDISSLETFCAGTDGFVSVWYDQTGNGDDLVQATAGSQAQIVSSGSVLKDGETSTYPVVRFADDYLTGTHGSAISNRDIMLFWVGNRTSASSDFSALFAQGSSTTSAIELGYEQTRFRVSGNNTLTNSQTENVARYPLNWMYAARTEALRPTSVTTYRNHEPMETRSHSESELTSTAVRVGSTATETGHFEVTDLIVYPLLSDADRRAVVDSQAAYFTTLYIPLSSTINSTIAPQLYDFQVAIYDWMETITESDVTVTYGGCSWDGTYADTDELFNLWLRTTSSSYQVASTQALISQPRWSILDDGAGAGIEGTGKLKYFRNGENTGSYSGSLATVYSTSFPKSGGAEGNPYYQHAPVGRRALMQAAINLITVIENGDESILYADFFGGGVGGSVDAYVTCKDLLDSATQQAFLDAFKFAAVRLKQYGARNANANMDCKPIPFLADVWVELDAAGDTYGATLMLEAAKKILFGSTTGTPATSSGFSLSTGGTGIYDPSGNIREGGSPESTYNGQSFKEISKAWSVVKGEAEWSFLGTMIEAYNDWMAHHSFTDGAVITGPSGFSGRTTASLADVEQGNGYKGKLAVLAEQGTGGRWRFRHQISWPSTGTLSSEITSAISTLNSGSYTASASALVTGTAAAHTSSVDYTGLTFTIDTATDELVIAGTNPFSINDRVAVYNRTGLTSDLSETTLYWCVASSGQRIQISTTIGGGAISLTDVGYGTHSFQSLITLTNTPDLSSLGATGVDYYANINSQWAEINYYSDANDIIGVAYGFNIASGSPVNYEIWSGPANTAISGYHWPILSAWNPPAGTYDALNTLFGSSDSTTYLPCERAASYSTSFDDRYWAFKGNDGTLDFAWFIELIEDNGEYSGFYGKGLEAFWVEDYGIAILSRRVDDGDEHNFGLIDTWPTFHMWGRDDETTPQAFTVDTGTDVFTSASHPFLERSFVRLTTTGALPSPLAVDTTYYVKYIDANTFQLSATPTADGTGPAIDVTGSPEPGSGTHSIHSISTEFDFSIDNSPDSASTLTLSTTDSATIARSIGVGTGISSGLRVGDEISGTMTQTMTFTEKSDGLTVQAAYTSDQADDVTELWVSIPIHLRADGTVIDDTVIHYWNGSTWVTLTTSLTSVDYLRMTRNHGAGDKYVWIHFASTTGVKLSAAAYEQGYQGNTRFRQIHCDMHPGTTGTATTLLASDSMSFDIVTTDPGLTPTNPSITANYPAASTVLYTNGIWFSQASVTFNGSTPSVKLQYSTDGVNFSDVASMTNVSGTTWQYVGEDVAIPSGLTHVRIWASDSAGTSTTDVACTAVTPTLVLDDPFTAANGTQIDPSYSGWTTNTTGNTWLAFSGYVEVQSNQIDGSWASAGHSSIAINSAASNQNSLIQGDMIFGAFSGFVNPHSGLMTRVNTSTNNVRAVFRSSTDFSMLNNSTLVDTYTGSFSTSNVYRVTLQAIGAVVVAKLVDVTGGGTVLDYLAHWGNASTSKAVGVCLVATSHHSDNFKLWR